MRPSKRAIFLAAAGFVFAILPTLISRQLWPFWTVFLSVGLLVFGLEWIFSTPRRQVSCKLETPEALYIGEGGEAVVTLRISSRNPTFFEAAIDLSEEFFAQPVTKGICTLNGIALRIPLIAKRRGIGEVEAIWIRYPGPVGILESIVKFPLKRRIPIVPNILSVRRAAFRSLSDQNYRAGLKIERYKGHGTEFDSLRDFVEGDDLRTVHWRSSARHKKIICRQFRAERNHQVILAIDTGLLMSEPLAAGIPKVDHAASAALLLAYIGLKSGDRVGFFTFGAKVGLFAAPQGGMAHHRKLTYLTSLISYSDTETNFTLGLTTLSQKLSRRSLVVVLTDFVDTVTAELMLGNLGRLAKKHVVVFVSLRDPDLQTLSRTEPNSVLKLNRAVVANYYLRERHIVLKRLKRQGLLTIDTEPAQIGPELINKYLYVKRRELI